MEKDKTNNNMNEKMIRRFLVQYSQNIKHCHREFLEHINGWGTHQLKIF